MNEKGFEIYNRECYAMFKPAKIIVDVRPTRASFQRIIRYRDKVGTDGYTVGVEMGLHKDGSFWVLDVVHGRVNNGQP